VGLLAAAPALAACDPAAPDARCVRAWLDAKLAGALCAGNAQLMVAVTDHGP
jgi:hypothetical protein